MVSEEHTILLLILTSTCIIIPRESPSENGASPADIERLPQRRLDDGDAKEGQHLTFDVSSLFSIH